MPVKDLLILTKTEVEVRERGWSPGLKTTKVKNIPIQGYLPPTVFREKRR